MVDAAIGWTGQSALQSNTDGLATFGRMNVPIDIMLDLESWGTDPGCDIRSIGACVFDPVAGTVCDNASTYSVMSDDPTGKTDGSFYLATSNPKGTWGRGKHRSRFFQSDRAFKRKYPLTRDPRTVQWWSEQSSEAQGAFADPVDLKDALERFAHWLCNFYPDGVFDAQRDGGALRLWSHGAATDGPWLAAAYRACGLPVPWHYRAPRDTRTIFDAAGIDDHSAWMAQFPGPLGIPHHSLDDSIGQARAVCGAMDIVRNAMAMYDAQHVVPAAPPMIVAPLRPEYLASMGDMEDRN